MVFCECGEEITIEDAKFCPECGIKINQDLHNFDKEMSPNNEKFTDPALKEKNTMNDKEMSINKEKLGDTILRIKKTNEILPEQKPLHDAMTTAIKGLKMKILRMEMDLNTVERFEEDRMVMRKGFKPLIGQINILIKQNEFIYLQNNEIIKSLERLNRKLEKNQFK